MSFKYLRRATLKKTPWIRDLSGAWVFYTMLPGLPFSRPTFDRIARFAPLIGILLGLIQGILWLTMAKIGWKTESITLIIIATGILLTGGIHLDGLMDTADGIGAGKEKCLEAMQDSRIGAIGVQALLITTLIQISSLIKLNELAPIALPIALFWSRVSPLWAIKDFPYLHQQGSAYFHRSNWKGLSEFVPSLIILLSSIYFLTLIPPLLINRPILISTICIGIFPAITIPHLLGNKLNGHSGDSYGATVVIVETIMLVLLALILKG